MPSNPENPQSRKEEILSKAPFTEVFLDVEHQKLDKETWATKYLQESQKIESEIQDRYGSNWVHITVAPLLIIVSSSNFFRPGLSEEERLRLGAALTKIGFELGSLEDIGQLLPDIVVASNALTLYDIGTNPNEDKYNQLVGLTHNFIKVGFYLRHLPQVPDDSNTYSAPINPTDPFQTISNN